MRAVLWGGVELVGRVPVGAVASGDGHVVLIITRAGEHSTAVGLRLDWARSRAVVAWTRPLAQGPYHRYRKDWTVFPPASVASLGATVALVSGDMRVLANTATGASVAEAKAAISPTGNAAIEGKNLLVPEGYELAAYDTDSLELRWRRTAPERLWTVGRPTYGMCPVYLRDESETGDKPRAGLWELAHDQVWVRFGCTGSTVAVGPTAVMSCGTRHFGIARATGKVVWSADSPPARPLAPRSHIADRAVADGERVICATEAPAVESRLAHTGEVKWRVDLIDDQTAAGLEPEQRAQPTALAVAKGLAWVGTQQGRAVAVNAATGSALGDVTLPHAAVALFPTSPRHAIAVTGPGDVYGLTLPEVAEPLEASPAGS